MGHGRRRCSREGDPQEDRGGVPSSGITSADGGAASPGAPTWVVDPIDGTNNFMRRIPVWATLIGLSVHGHMVVGVCHAPMLDEVYDAARGRGARLNGVSIAVDPVSSLEDATFLFAGGENFVSGRYGDLYRTLAVTTERSRGFGDFWGHMLVARGAAHVMVEDTLKPWDVLPLLPIVSEAGGKVTHLDGSEWLREGSCLTTNGFLHEDVLRLAAASGIPSK
ncbi:MAG: histidinol phosphatase [Actinobacteria bacterium]|nr:histidinol phosphatase [Actinomycetota bacterium]